MKIGPDEVRHVARLAELAVADTEIDLLAGQLGAIVAFVEQLGDASVDAAVEPLILGPAALRLREDAVAPIPMSAAPARFAPGFTAGFFTVPKLSGMTPE